MFKIVLFIFTIFASSFAEKDFSQNPDFLALESQIEGINSIQGRGVQKVENEVLKFDFFIKLSGKRRGKMRADFSNGTTFIIRDNTFVYYDKKNDQQSTAKLQRSGLTMLLEKGPSLKTSGFNVEKFTQNGLDFQLQLASPEIKDTQFIFFFKKTNKQEMDFQLEKIQIKMKPEESEMSFFDVVINSEISDKVFQLKAKKIDAKFNF